MNTKKKWAPLGAEDVGRNIEYVPGFVQVSRRVAIRIRAHDAAAPLRCSECESERRNGGYRWFARAEDRDASGTPSRF